jgi:hypothetical protein
MSYESQKAEIIKMIKNTLPQTCRECPNRNVTWSGHDVADGFCPKDRDGADCPVRLQEEEIMRGFEFSWNCPWEHVRLYQSLNGGRPL